MRRTVTRPISEYFRPYYSEQVHPEYRKQVYYSGRRIFNKVTWLVVLLAGATWLGIIDSRIYAAELSILIAVGTSYFQARRAARGLAVRRHVPGQATQGDWVEVGIEVVNGGRRAVRDLIVRDRFTGSSDPQIVIWVDEWVPTGKTWRGSYRRCCDGGMGIHALSGLSISMTDRLGIFEIAVEEDSRVELAVYPERIAIPELAIAGQRESFSHGKYDTRSRGGSANFTSLRSYARGDSLRHVSWKASARMGKLMVKEFESVANTDVSILLDMAAPRHAGTDSHSSWEQAKSAALSILAQQLANGNRVALLSQGALVPAGGGESHLNLIAQLIFRLRPKAEAKAEGDLVGLLPFLTPGTTAVYIGPILPGIPGNTAGNFALLRDRLLRLRVREVKLICLLIDAASFLRGEPLEGLDAATMTAIRGSSGPVRDEARSFAGSGVAAFVLEKGLPIGEALLGTRREAVARAPGVPPLVVRSGETRS